MKINFDAPHVIEKKEGRAGLERTALEALLTLKAMLAGIELEKIDTSKIPEDFLRKLINLGTEAQKIKKESLDI